jgi:serine protease Do
MNNRCKSKISLFVGAALTMIGATLGSAPSLHAQNFDFDRLLKQASVYTVVLDVKVEYTFGADVNEQEERLLGTIVRADGLIIFDGGFLSEENPFMPTGGFTFRSTPRRIKVTTIDRKEYSAEFVGVDAYTGFGFALITGADRQFTPARFVKPERLRVGDWLATLVLLPEYVEPPLATDVAMVSAVITQPEKFPLTVGFSPFEFGSVLYDSRLNPVGLLGQMEDPTGQSGGGAAMMGEFQQMNIPLLGVITLDRLEALIANPPRRGQAARSWLGITMQSLTADIAEFLGLGAPGGVIVNEIVPGSPAEAGGLKVGDVITEVDGRRVEVDREEKLSVFQRQVASKTVGSTADLTVMRPLESGLDTLHLKVILAAAPLAASDAADFEYVPYELTVRNLVFSDYVGYNVEMNSLSGVVVTSMQPGGLADISGLAPGDVIQRVNDRPVASVEEFAQVMQTVDSEQPTEVVLLVWRFGQTVFVNVRME